MRGLYIVVEGIDGCGKDTQADLLYTKLEELGLNPLRVAEPCEDLPTGKLLRQFLASGEYRKAHAALFLSDRFALQESVIKPALDAGRPVISVRSFMSTLVYQQDHWPLDWLYQIHAQMLCKPTDVVLLDVDPAVGMERVGKRGQATEIYEKIEIQERNRERYSDLVKDPRFHRLLTDEGTPRIHVVDAMRTRAEVHERIWAEISAPRNTLLGGG